MGENKTKLDSGKLYFIEPDGSTSLLGHVTEFDCTAEDIDISVPVTSIPDVDAAFEMLAKATKDLILTLTGMCQAVIECCPDKRVVHLALHGKKARTRKKNFNRAIKILEEN